MSEKHSIANRKRWAGISKDERSKRGTHMSVMRWDKSTEKERHDHAMKMVRGRKKAYVK